MIDDLTRLGLRATLGGYFVGHGAQKVFGALGGSGPEAAGEHFEEMGLAPGREMALLAGTTEMVGGTLTALGLGGPIGPLAIGSVMAVAANVAHRGRGPFAADGGPELPLTNLAAASSLVATGPGRLSLDRLLHVRVPRTLAALAVAGAVAGATAIVRSALNRTRQEEPHQPPLPLASDDGAREFAAASA